VIHWKDFVLDDICGPVLNEELLQDVCVTVYRRKRCGPTKETFKGQEKCEEQPAQKQTSLDEEYFSFLGTEESMESFSSDSWKVK